MKNTIFTTQFLASSITAGVGMSLISTGTFAFFGVFLVAIGVASSIESIAKSIKSIKQSKN